MIKKKLHKINQQINKIIILIEDDYFYKIKKQIKQYL